MSGVRALESTLNYIRFLEDKNKELREQNDFLEDEKRRCYLDMKKDEETIERLKRSNLYLTQIVIDSYSESKRSSMNRRKLGRKWRAR
ncbi:hypothetical protein BU202_08130 [Streptococcus cuniculi]|uniref:Uncharacterized protein n=2 Tax=Streptococcus cuniculi TaxID=1432788 RepID=A0A1Q8E6G9_9STRE|nr:hypothetical protein BU202_08130 [Streptococcus cuniculi]